MCFWCFPKKVSPYEEIDINKTYMRSDAESFSLPPPNERNLENLVIGKCNYFTNRDSDSSIKYITQSYSTNALRPSLDYALSYMVLKEGKDMKKQCDEGVSVHYLIDFDGKIYQLVPGCKKPRAAGKGALKAHSILNPSDYEMDSNMNTNCLSIMTVTDGGSPLNQEQVNSNLRLTKHLVQKHKIDPKKVIAIADWTPGRHIAPGPYFPWKTLAKNELGLWSNVERKSDPEIILSYDIKPLPEDVDHVEQQIKELSDKFGKLGMVGQRIRRDNSYLDSKLISNMLCFNLHHLGEQILNNHELKITYDEKLLIEPSDPDARGVLARWTTNSQAVLDDILNKYCK